MEPLPWPQPCRGDLGVLGCKEGMHSIAWEGNGFQHGAAEHPPNQKHEGFISHHLSVGALCLRSPPADDIRVSHLG